MESTTPGDRSNGYEAVAGEFIARRSRIGAAEVREWARSLPKGGAVLDLGCGHGVPITQTLIEEGLRVYGVDASRALLAELQLRFPTVVTACSAAEESDFFGRTFDGVVAWGILFLLTPEAQRLLIRKVSRVMNPDGTFLFTAPRQAGEWVDVLTGRTSVSLGGEAYRAMLLAEGLILGREQDDEGDNHYYLATKPT